MLRTFNPEGTAGFSPKRQDTPSELFLRLIGLYPHAAVNPPKFGQAECLALSKSKKLNTNFPNEANDA
jgi:hypothetical protein